jgi:hypothetical protein
MLDMGLFTKKRTFKACMHGVRGKMVKQKRAKGERGTVGAGERKKVIEVTFHIQLTKALKELIDPRVSALLSLAESEADGATETPISKVGYDKVERQVRLAVKEEGKDEPAWVRGGAPNDDPAKVTLKSIVVVEKTSFLVIVAQVRFGKDVWNWGGDNLDEGVCRVEMTPIQLELPLEGEAETPADDKK